MHSLRNLCLVAIFVNTAAAAVGHTKKATKQHEVQAMTEAMNEFEKKWHLKYEKLLGFKQRMITVSCQSSTKKTRLWGGWLLSSGN